MRLTGEMLYRHAVGHSKPWAETSMQPLFNEAARGLNEELRGQEGEDVKVLLKAFNDLLDYHLFGAGNVVEVLNDVLKVLQRHPELAK